MVQRLRTGTLCSLFLHSPTAEQHRRMGMIIQLAILWPRMVVEQLHRVKPCISASPAKPRTRPAGAEGVLPSVRLAGNPSLVDLRLPASEPGPKRIGPRRPPGLRERAAGTGSGESRAEAPAHEVWGDQYLLLAGGR